MTLTQKMRKAIITIILFLCGFVFPSSILAYSTNMSASVVVGQANFTGNTENQGGAVAANTVWNAYAPIVINGKFIIPDCGNSRLLVFNSIPTSNNASANVVIGQSTMSGGSDNQGGAVGANTLACPTSLTTDGTKLIIADWTNNRVLIYNTVPTSNNASADVVIGQPNLTSNTPGVTSQLFHGPEGVSYDAASGKLFIADYSNNRVLIYNSIPTSNNAAADMVVGQANFTSGSGNRGGSIGGNTLSGPYVGKVLNSKFVVVDATNDRVLIWNSIPTSSVTSADTVLGQTALNVHVSTDPPTASSLCFPSDADFTNNELFVFDACNGRVAIFSGIPTTNNTAMTKAIGQTSTTTSQNNQGGSPGANTLSWSGDGGIRAYGNQLFVADNGNRRVLIFNDDTPPATPTPTSTPTATPPITPIQTSTPSPTGAVTEHHSAFVPNPNKKDGWQEEINAGPEFVGDVKPITEVSAPDAWALIQREAVHDPVHLGIHIISPFDLSIITSQPVPLPWKNGISIYSDMYDFHVVSAFNGAQIFSSDSPYTITLPYDQARLGRMNPQNLRIAYYDRTTGTWKLLRNNTVLNWEKHTISNTATLFTYFAVGYSAGANNYTSVLGASTKRTANIVDKTQPKGTSKNTDTPVPTHKLKAQQTH